MLAERVILNPELSDPAINVSRRIIGVEVVEVVLGEWLLGTLPHKICHPGGEDIADGVRIDGVNLGLVVDLVDLLGDTSLNVDVVEIPMGRLELDFGVRGVEGLGGSGGAGREAVLSGRNSSVT